jgi:putative SbcD/Mre11-related phosphoesterase
MKILNDFELIDLALYTNKTLVVSDFHIGYEEALNKQGILVPRFQFSEIIKRLDSIFKKLKNKKIETVVVNGDLKHEFGTISEQEWRHTLRLLDYFGERCNNIVLIRGNHDTVLGPIAEKRNVKVLDYYLICSNEEISSNDFNYEDSINKNEAPLKKISVNSKSSKQISIKDPWTKKIATNKLKTTGIKNESLKNKANKNFKNKKNKILCLHGDKIPDKDLLKGVSTIIIGHEHPAVSIHEGARSELFKCFLIGSWRRKNIIVLPSFNLVTEGTDILKEKALSPFLKNLKDFEVVVVADRLYGFGRVRTFAHNILNS